MIIETRTDYGGYPSLSEQCGLPRNGKSSTYPLRIDAETLTAHIERSKGGRNDPGTATTIRKLRNPRLWTGPKVKKAIEEELWGRLLEKGLTVRVRDRSKEYDVIPKERAFEGLSSTGPPCSPTTVPCVLSSTSWRRRTRTP
ncbi:MAG: hypothetical protein V3U52_04810 [Thermoplasmata archaeon]